MRTAKVEISKHKDSFWLWDETRGCNLAMRAKTEKEALLETIAYYQHRLLEVESKYKELDKKVNVFLEQFQEEEDY